MRFLLLCCFALLQPLHSQGPNRVILRDVGRAPGVSGRSVEPCQGHVEVYYNNTPGYVGDKHWSGNTDLVVCRTTHCGTPVRDAQDVQRETGRTVWLNELRCQGNESSLWDCPGWPGPGLSYYQKPTVKKVTCSHQVRLKLEQSECEGAVRYSTDGGTNYGYFCNDNWRQPDAALLCKQLGCGGARDVSKPARMLTDDFDRSTKMKVNCNGIVDVTNLWQCVAGETQGCKLPASVTCEGHRRLQLQGNPANVCSGRLQQEAGGSWTPVSANHSVDGWCRRLHCGSYGNHTRLGAGLDLTCSDQVQVVLMDRNKETRCFGLVHVKVNDTARPVCASSWTQKEADLVCKELNCGTMITWQTSRTSAAAIMDHVSCLGTESSLWFCNGRRGHNIPCQESPYIYCSKSMEVELQDGPGRCAGRLAVLHQGEWKRVQTTGWEDSYSNRVCKQLKCGKQSNISQTFIKGSGDFMKIQNCGSGKNISECFTSEDRNRPQVDMEPVVVTCEKHKVLVLSETCSGNVGIWQENRVKWLSGSNDTWNAESANTVCRQMHCGKAVDFTAHPLANDTMEADAGTISYRCPAAEKSLFDCRKMSRPDDANHTMAYVKCSGNIHLNLSEGCWGYVDVYLEKSSGGLCEDTWTDEQSQQLCSDLGCGSKTFPSYSQRKSRTILFKSLHSSGSGRSLHSLGSGRSLHSSGRAPLSQSSFVSWDDARRGCNPAYVVCEGSIRTKLSPSRDRCSGNVLIHYEGQWLPVQRKALESDGTGDAVCRELDCGVAVETIPYFPPRTEAQKVVTKLRCSSNERLRDCEIEAGTTSNVRLGGLRCSGWRKMALEVEHACRGDVVVRSEGRRSFVSSHGWTDVESNRLCSDLNCGRVTNHTSVKAEPGSLWNSTFHCSRVSGVPGVSAPESIWDCETRTRPSGQDKLFIQCGAEPSVSLSGPCGGTLDLDGFPVCSSSWDLDYAHRVCQELDCGNAVVNSSSPHTGEGYHVSCDHHQYKLGQCKRARGACTGRVSIYCTERVEFNVTRKCGGSLQIRVRDGWEYVAVMDASTELQEKLCRGLNCTPKMLQGDQRPQDMSGMTTSLACKSGAKDLKYCVNLHAPKTKKPAVFYCHGYEKEKTIETPSVPTVAIVLGVGVAVVSVILIAVFARYYFIRRNKKRRMSRNDGEFYESGEYEDVDKLSEMDDFGRDGFGADSELMGEKDRLSASSLPYDDVDEVTEGQPLTPPRSSEAPQDEGKDGKFRPTLKLILLRGNANHSFFLWNGVTYEVEDVQENYDDIDADPGAGADADADPGEAPRTTAQVHDAPDPGAAPPAGRLQEDGDYLVPGEDG
ncbi:antigen WC1.1 [Cololabis saira]|uniref:antigen WC1.1 n=1 Tax=Cololabis saira TaxID=129043 RepID=UPI002AD2C45D|nr:antigen WC1.1 [Cololabis saira]